MNIDPSEWGCNDWDDHHRRDKMLGKGDPTEWSVKVWENPLPKITEEEFLILRKNNIINSKSISI